MSRAAKSVGVVLLLASGACASTRAARVAPPDPEATLNALRAQNSGYVRRIEELQNRVFILEDRLDSYRVVGQQRAVPTLPVSRSVALGVPRDEEAATVEPGTLPPRVDHSSETARLDTDVEYVGEAVQPMKARPVLRLDRGPARAPAVARPARAAKAPPASPPPQPLSPPPLFVPAVPAAEPPPVASAAPAPVTPAVPLPVTPAIPVVMTVPDLSTSEDARPPEAIPAEPLRLYRAALLQLRTGHHGEALAGFRRFLGLYPTHDYADNAQYWIGECYYDLKQHQTAAREFRRVVERFPRGNKVPDALLKLGFSHLLLGQTVEGREVLESLVRAYPRHASAALASTRLAELPRSGKAQVNLGNIAPVAPVTPGSAARPPAPRRTEVR